MSQLQSSVSSREGQPYLGGRANSALGGAQFEAFEVNFLNRELRKDGIPVKLPEKPLQVLEALLAKAGDMVRREELREKLWPDPRRVRQARPMWVSTAASIPRSLN